MVKRRFSKKINRKYSKKINRKYSKKNNKRINKKLSKRRKIRRNRKSKLRGGTLANKDLVNFIKSLENPKVSQLFNVVRSLTILWLYISSNQQFASALLSLLMAVVADDAVRGEVVRECFGLLGVENLEEFIHENISKSLDNPPERLLKGGGVGEAGRMYVAVWTCQIIMGKIWGIFTEQPGGEYTNADSTRTSLIKMPDDPLTMVVAIVLFGLAAAWIVYQRGGKPNFTYEMLTQDATKPTIDDEVDWLPGGVARHSIAVREFCSA